MRHPEKAKQYYDQPVEIFHGNPSEPNTCIKRLAHTGVHFREFTVDTGKGGEVIEIDQITDVHFNYCSEKDLQDEELAFTVKCRKWLANASSVPACDKAMEMARLSDLVIVTGDTLDYLSEGAIELTYRHIWDADPDALIALGGHDVTKQMETAKPDQLPLAERYAMVEKSWKHNVYYESRELGGKVIAVVLDNGQSCYWESQVPHLEADIKRAKEQGMAVLIFQHEPISTGDPANRHTKAFRRYDPEECDYYGRLIGGPDRNHSAASLAVYELITKNADVVRGIFVGHMHSAFYTEVRGSYTDSDGTVHEKNIPQITLEGNPYDDDCGHVMRIYVR